MNVPSYGFLAFAAVVAVAINLSADLGWRRAVLAVANLTFFVTLSPDLGGLAPFTGLLLFGFAAMKLLERWKKRIVFVVLLAALILVFCALKRYAFVPHELSLNGAYVTVGMSYVFFRILHLVIDAFQDALSDRVSPVSYLNYTLNFASLVSGPIQLYKDYRRTESYEPAPLSEHAVIAAFERIVTGFFKVMVASPILLFAHAHSLERFAAAASSEQRIAWAVLVVAVYPVYLFLNFSGYTDFVIGVARFLRLELPENFDHPFQSEGFIEFWNRWHITLSSWLKTYVYSPLLLTLMRRYPSRAMEPFLGVLAYFVTFFLIGLWHGQSPMFVVFGALLGLGVSVNKLYQILMIRRLGRRDYRELCTNPTYCALSRGATYTWFAFSLLWFWAAPPQLGGLFRQLGVAGAVVSILVSWMGASVALWAVASGISVFKARTAEPRPPWAWSYARTAWCAVLVMLIVSVTVVLEAPAPHVVYKGF